MQILVTGGAGFIGSHLTTWLVKQGHHVRVFDNFSSGRAVLLEPVAHAVEIQRGDLRDRAAVFDAASGMDAIIHLAAMVSVTQSVEQPLEAQHCNATGSLHVLEAARAAQVRRVVLASSCAVYGDTTRLPVGEDTPPDPLSPYAATKLAMEQLGRLYTQLYGLETVALRFFNVYGPRQDPASPYAAAIPRFIATLRAGRQPTIYGDGRQTRDFIYVGDIVQALWTAATAPDIAGEVFNAGRGEAISILDLVTQLAELLDLPAKPHFAAARDGEVRHSQAQIMRFRERAGFRAAVGLRDGLAATLAADCCG